MSLTPRRRVCGHGCTTAPPVTDTGRGPTFHGDIGGPLTESRRRRLDGVHTSTVGLTRLQQRRLVAGRAAVAGEDKHVCSPQWRAGRARCPIMVHPRSDPTQPSRSSPRANRQHGGMGSSPQRPRMCKPSLHSAPLPAQARPQTRHLCDTASATCSTTLTRCTMCAPLIQRGALGQKMRGVNHPKPKP